MNTHNPLSVDAIDFAKLYKEEKRKARLARQKKNKKEQQQQQQGQGDKKNDDDESSTKSPPAVTESKLSSRQQQEEYSLPVWKYNYSESSGAVVTSKFNKKKDCLTDHLRRFQSVYYKRNYLIDEEFRNELWNWLQSLPENTVDQNNECEANGKWTYLKHAKRRVALFDIITTTSKKQQEEHSSCKHQFPEPLQIIINSLMMDNIFPIEYKPNHILINEYNTTTTSSQGIMAHTDGPAYYNRTATISLGTSSVLLNFIKCHNNHNNEEETDSNNNNNNNNNKYQVLLEGHGSLVVFENDAYSNYMHSIEELLNGTSTVEHANDYCLNAEPGTAVLRGDNFNRISITIRCKINKNK